MAKRSVPVQLQFCDSSGDELEESVYSADCSENSKCFHIIRFYDPQKPLGVAGIVPRIWTRYRQLKETKLK